MIYQTNSFEKEFRNSYMQQKFSRKRQLSLGVFLGLITFAVYFCLQTLSQSVVADAAPHLMMASYFSTLYLYLYVSLAFNVILFIANYEYMSYVEVMRNRWYPLVQLGYKPLRLIMTKLVVRIFAQAYIFIVGFITTIFLSSFLKFPFVPEYLLSLFVVGLLDVLLLSTVSLAASLFFRNVVNARYVVGMIGVAIVVGKLVSGFSQIVSDRTRMSSIQNLFDLNESLYLITCAVLIIVCLVTIVARGKQLAQVYNLPLLWELPALTQQKPGTVVLANRHDKIKKKTLESQIEASVDAQEQKKHFSLPVFMTTLLLIVSIVVMLGVNALVLICGYASPEKETSVFGTIPYVFQSYTMEPTIMMNDLALFHKMDYQEAVKVDEVVLFKDVAGTVTVARVKEIVELNPDNYALSTLRVDIDNYVDTRYRGMAEQTIERQQIYGSYTDSNRWLGAIILFANTTLGRLILLLIPTFLVFFYDPITKFFRHVSSERETPTGAAKAPEKKEK